MNLILSIVALIGLTTSKLISKEYPSNPNLMPNIGNGYLGYVVDSDSVYVAGLYCFTRHVLLFPGSQRCRVPVPPSMNYTVSGSELTSVELNVENGMVTKQFSIPNSSIKVTQNQYAHRTKLNLFVNEFVIDNSDNESDFDVNFKLGKVSKKAADIGFAEVETQEDGIKGMQGVNKNPERGDNVMTVAYAYTVLGEANLVKKGEVKAFYHYAAIHTEYASTFDLNPNPIKDAVGDIKAAFKDAGLKTDHINAWGELWLGGVEVDDEELGDKFNSSLYYMLSSLHQDVNWPTGPGGLPTNGYWGNAFWDNDMWSMLAVLPWWPELAQTGIQYRYDRLPWAQVYAKAHKASGLYYPWQTAATGSAVDLVEFTNILEKHTGGDISNTLRMFWDVTHEESFLNKIKQINEGICQFYISVAVKDANGKYSINNVVPPDEFAFGIFYQGVDNSVFTNAAAGAACEFADRLEPNAQYKDFAENVVILTEKHGNATIHPEYEGFPSKNFWTRHVVKQADVTLLGFPLDYQNITKEQRLADLKYYEPMYAADGPAMTESMHSVAWLELDEAESADKWFKQSQANMQKPFNIWTESKSPNQHFSFTDEGCYNFLTGAGGFIQSIIYGFGGLRIRADGLHLKPQVPKGSSSIKFRGLQYKDARFSVKKTSSETTICLEKKGKADLQVEVQLHHSVILNEVGSCVQTSNTPILRMNDPTMDFEAMEFIN